MYDRNQLAVREDRSPIVPYIPPRIMMPPGQQSEGRGEGILQIIGRHPFIVLVVTALIMSLAGLYLKRATKFYTATTKIGIRSNEPVLTGAATGNPEGSAMADDAFLNTQASIITSARVLDLMLEREDIRVLNTLRMDLPGGNSATGPTTIPTTLSSLTTMPATGPATRPIDRLNEKRMLILKKAISVEVGRKDQLLSISVETPYPEESQLLANEIVDAYKRYQELHKDSSAKRQLAQKEKEKATIQVDLIKVSNEITEFQDRHQDVTVDIRTQKLAQEVQMRNQAYISAQNRRLEMEETAGPQHPSTLKAKSLEAELFAKLQEAEAQLANVDKNSAVLAGMQETHKRLRTQLVEIDQAMRQLEFLRDRAVATVEVFEPASLPEKASSPNPVKTLGLALIIGLVLGSLLALLRDVLDQRMRSAEEVRAIMGVPILGIVPKMPHRQTAVARAMCVHLEPKSIVAEAYRTVRTAIFFAVPEGQGRTILVTSPAPGDGKTTSASNLAIAIAQTGRRALLLDADFRKPSQHKNLEVKDDIGLSSVLSGKEPLERAIQRTGVEGLDILPCGPIPANPSEILNSQGFVHLVQRLAQKYDHILVDSPPVNSVADARILAAMCDIVILCLRSEKTTRKSAEHARDALLSVGGRILGVVVNDVSRARAGEHYGGGYGFYGQQHATAEGFGEREEAPAGPRSTRPVAADVP